ncbi:hypothetical protein [Rhodopila sp.]|uniref:hypothetical protein n=1 Tax=Rhodopila sp. TaxID=2480087 RepID=UPI002CC832D8|nr:hypothetical protein [Rhodopila sp.]HVZ10204.1 hypothetical protein [Rhodopila sp.]
MASNTPIHDFLRPRINALVRDIVAQGHPRDAAVAVLIDIVTAPDFDTAAPDPLTDTAPHPDYQRSPDVVLVNNQAVSPPHQPGQRDEDDFVRSIGWLDTNP